MIERRPTIRPRGRVWLWGGALLLSSPAVAACGGGPPPTVICAPDSAVKDKLDSQQQQGDAPPVFDPSAPGLAAVGPSDGGNFGEPKTLGFTNAAGNVVRTIVLTNTLPEQAKDLLARYNKSHKDNSLSLHSVDGGFAWNLVYEPPAYELGITCPPGGPLYSPPSSSPSAS